MVERFETLCSLPKITMEGWCLSLFTFCSASISTDLLNESYAGYCTELAWPTMHNRKGHYLTTAEHEVLPHKDAKFCMGSQCMHPTGWTARDLPSAMS